MFNASSIQECFYFTWDSRALLGWHKLRVSDLSQSLIPTLDLLTGSKSRYSLEYGNRSWSDVPFLEKLDLSNLSLCQYDSVRKINITTPFTLSQYEAMNVYSNLTRYGINCTIRQSVMSNIISSISNICYKILK